MPAIEDYARMVRALLENVEANMVGSDVSPELVAHVGHLTALVLDGAPEPDAMVPVGHEDPWRDTGGEG